MRGKLNTLAWIMYAVGFFAFPLAMTPFMERAENLAFAIGVGWFDWMIWGRRIARYAILPVFFSAVRCPGCGYEKEAVGRWTCGCGFVDHRERNVLAMRCPQCKAHIGSVPCDQCQATILL